jgi:preprotein translocase subunit SecG
VPLKYERNGQPFNTTLSDGNNTSVLIWAVFTRSYLVQAEIDSGAGTGNGGTKRIVEITVPVLVTVVLILCLGLGYRWRKKQQQHQKKRDLETEKQGMGTEKLGMPELGEGLRHEIEGRSLGATADKEQDIEISELDSNIPLQESKNKIAGVELDSRDIREMAANVPAAHEVGATDRN